MDNAVVTRHHLMIAGTGRSGTSFLVRYLGELGLDTRSRRGGAGWDENANAGLEEAPFAPFGEDPPYVIKSPWLYHYIDDVLQAQDVALDGVIVPVRDLAEAAASRSVLQLRAIHETAPWMAEQDESWEDWGYVPGGVVFSLNPIDQGRLLAVGFHHLVQRLVEADVPIILLPFPRMIADADALFDKLRPLLPQSINRALAAEAHRAVAELEKVRVGPELKDEAGPGGRIMSYPSTPALDRVALRRELKRLQAAAHAAQHAAQLVAAAAARDQMAALERSRDALGDELRRCGDERAALRERLAAAMEERDRLAARLLQVEGSRSWRLTGPARRVYAKTLGSKR